MSAQVQREAATSHGRREPRLGQLQAHSSVVFISKRKKVGQRAQRGDRLAALVERLLAASRHPASASALEQAYATVGVSLLLVTNESQV